MIAPRSIANAPSTRPSISRALVVLLIVCWLVVAAQLPYSLHGAGILALLALVGLDALLFAEQLDTLIQSTGGHTLLTLLVIEFGAADCRPGRLSCERDEDEGLGT